MHRDRLSASLRGEMKTPATQLVPLVALALSQTVCGPATANDSNENPRAVVDAGETVLTGEVGTDFEGVELVVPAGVLDEGTEVEIRAANDETPLPTGAHAIGGQFAVLPTNLAPPAPLRMTVPYDPDRLAEFDQTPVMVKVWLRRPDLEKGWELLEQTASDDTTVTVPLKRGGTLGPGVKVE